MSESKQTEYAKGNQPYISLYDGQAEYPYTGPADPNDVATVESYYGDMRARILHEVRHEETGLNVGRVAKFLDHYGLPMHDFIAVDSNDMPALENLVGGAGGDEAKTTGAYFAVLDLSYVVRNRAAEAANGPELTESLLVHEIGHASAKNKPLGLARTQSGEIGTLLLRSGFSVKDNDGEERGSFFEEGFAGLMEHRYVTEELAMPNGFPQKAGSQELSLNGNPYKLPQSFFVKSSKKNKIGISVSSHSAYGIELLIAKDPAIFDAMLKSRTDIEGLREFAKRIEALSPGLYSALSRVPYETRDFMEATNLIIEKIYEGDQDKALEAYSGLSSLSAA